jgi:SAM-dependent methyltransferase
MVRPGGRLCQACNIEYAAAGNYVDFLGDRRTETGRRYAEFFGKMESGKFGPPELEYDATKTEEFDEFLRETRTSKEDLRGKVILDAGCGTGRLAVMLAEEGARVFALDIHERLAYYASRCADPAVSPYFVKADVGLLPFEDMALDLVWCQGVLSYVGDPSGALKELQRVTKIGGAIYAWAYYRPPNGYAGRMFLLSRKMRGLPGSLREPLFDLATIVARPKMTLSKLIRGAPLLDDDRIHIRDLSMADEVNFLSPDEVSSMFQNWEVISYTTEDNAVSLLARRLRA